MSIGRGYTKWLTREEQEALSLGWENLIHSLFDEYKNVDPFEPESIFLTKLGKHLPRQYASKYSPVFFKQFGVCVVVVVWKLAQPKPVPPVSFLEVLAVWTLVQEARLVLRQITSQLENRDAFHAFLGGYIKQPNLSFLSERIEEKEEAVQMNRLSSYPFEQWFPPFSRRGKSSIHPYTFEGERIPYVGQAMREQLRRFEREALQGGMIVLIDEIFEDFSREERSGLENIAWTNLASHLPRHYFPRYSPHFLKQFAVCILIVAWKLAQPQPLVLSSIAEELATNAILTSATELVALEQEEENGKVNTDFLYDHLLEIFVEDTDFTFLFDESYDGIDTTPGGQLLHMTSLSFKDWFKPFSNAPERIAHPFVS